MIRLAILPFIAATIAGCPQLDVLEGKPSPAQLEHERRQALLLPPAAEATVTPAVTASAEPELVAPPPAAPVCHETFRINRCGPKGALPW